MIDEKVTKYVKKHIDDSNQQSIYIYGIINGLRILLNILTVIAIGLLTGNILNCGAFMLAFIPLRIFCGGYHAKDSRICYFYSTMLILVALFASHTLYIGETLIPIAIIDILLLLLAPVDTQNKKLDSGQRKKVRRIVLVLLSIYTAIEILLTVLHLHVLFNLILISMTLVLSLVIIGTVSNYLHVFKIKRV